MAATFRVSVVTPEREVLAVEARFAALPAYDGEIGILPRRAALLTQLGSGVLRVEDAAGGKRQLFVSGGFAQMVDDKLTLLTEEAREPETLPADAANASLSEAAALPATTDAEFARKQRVVARARALRRLRR
ncbi:MAG TPA: ATP synthase F1 subunit epsilon [Thermoanaerobaculia bacterium]